MKLTFIGAGAVLVLAGLAIWLVPFYRIAQANWIPLSIPVSLVSNFSLRTNCNANTPGRYGAYIVFDRAGLDLKDDTPEDDTKYPRRIPANVQLQVAGRQGMLLETNLTRAELASEGAVVSYRLGDKFDLAQPDQVSITLSNTPSADSVRTGNPRLEIQLSAALLEGRVMAVYLGRRRGMSLAALGLALLIIGFFLPSNQIRTEAT